MNKVLEEEDEQDEGWELSFFIVFSVPSLQTQTQHVFSMNPLTVLYLQTISSPLTPFFYNIKIIGLKRVLIRSGRGSTCLPPVEGRHRLLLKTQPPQEQRKGPGGRGVRPAESPSCCTHPALTVRVEELVALLVMLGKK